MKKVKKQTEKDYIDRVMSDGKQRRVNDIIKAIMDYIDNTPGKVSYHFVPEAGMVARYLKKQDGIKYILIEQDSQSGNLWKWLGEEE
tara:strand:+ start:856 stop:1116 length:261 start_codon:yes stop_codon:yes gene_type:complete